MNCLCVATLLALLAFSYGQFEEEEGAMLGVLKAAHIATRVNNAAAQINKAAAQAISDAAVKADAAITTINAAAVEANQAVAEARIAVTQAAAVSARANNAMLGLRMN